MSVTAPLGFAASGVTAGIRPSGAPDVALVRSLRPAVGAALWTRNRVLAAPVVVSRRHLATAEPQAVIVNAGVVGWVRFKWETAATLRLRGQLAEMRESGLTYDVSTRYFSASADERLSEAGVKFHDVGDKRGADCKELMSVVEGYPLANRYHPAADRP